MTPAVAYTFEPVPLWANSYIRMQRTEEAQVELRELVHELFEVWPKQPFMRSRVSSTGMLVSTENCFQQIGIRHRYAHYPL